ncbi:unnamed protein product, partial [Rodentolepis nana]|uniref:Titin n=1 Tax=Rodentolepis nana TaxID=102285 RepID=A0A0R3T329_RODNA
MSDREDISTQSSSDFSDSFPSTTTISTVAVQAGQSKIILAVLRCGTWIKVRIQRMEPDLYDVGASGTSTEVRQLLEQHASLVSKLAAKQVQISELLTRAEEMVGQQPTEGQARVYSAMSSSLNKAWRELLDVLGKRGHLLQLVSECFENAEAVHAAVSRIIEASASGDWGNSIETVEQLIQEHEELKRLKLLEPTRQMLEAANGALELLTRMAVRTGQTPESGLTRTSSEARERIAAVTGDANEARRLAEAAWERRARLLQLRYTVVRLETEHEQVVQWFSRVGEPNLATALPGGSLQECESAMEALMGLAVDAREYQHINTRLVRQAQQLTLPRGENEDEPDIDMQTAHNALVERFATSEKYIWEFIDRIESRRRCLQASIIFFSEASVLLEHLRALENDITMSSKTRTEVRDEIFQRLTELEMRVPGLREILFELRSRVDERPSATTLSLSRSVPPARPVSPLTVGADAAMSAKLHEIEEIIARCRMACGGFPALDASDQQLREIDYRLTALWRWTHETVSGVLKTHHSPGTTISFVSDFEDIHRRLERMMTSQESEISNLRTLILNIAPSTEKQNFQRRLDEIVETWARYRRTITIRLRMAEDLNGLLRRIREDEYYYQAVNDRIKSIAAGRSQIHGGVDMRVSRQLREGEMTRIHSDMMEVRTRLESQQMALKSALEEISRIDDADTDKTEPQNFYRSQIQLNLERLNHVEEQLRSLQSTRQIWLSWEEKWNDFTRTAKRLDEAMASSRVRIVRAPRSQSIPAVEADLAEHLRDGDYVNQLIAEVNAKANTLASLVGAEPASADGPSRVRRYIEVPDSTSHGPGDADLVNSVRSELCVATAGLEVRSRDWEHVFNAHKHTLEERIRQIGRMTEMDSKEFDLSTHFFLFEKIERDLQDAESEFQRISITVNLDAPIAQIERADESLRILEQRIPDLQGQVRSTAFLPGMQPIRGPSDLLEISTADVPLLQEKRQQFENRVSNLAAGTNTCRTEINLTLQILRAVRDAENRLSTLTVDLARSSDRLRSLTPGDQVQMRQIISDIEAQRDRAYQYVVHHVPQLQSLAAQYPGDRAKTKIQPIISRFQDSTESLTKLAQDVRVRSEQFVDLARLQGPIIEAVESVASHQMHAPRPSPPRISLPLPNIHVAEGTHVTLETTFDNGIPQGYPDTVNIEGTWYRDGLPVTTPDYRTRMDQHSASLVIEEVFGDDTGVFTFRIKTPFGAAETSGSLTVTETHKSLTSVDEEMITPLKRRRTQAPPTFPPFEEEIGEAPRFIRPLRSTNVNENEPVMLECRATGQPTPQISWFKDGVNIDNNPDYVIFEVNGSCALKIRNASTPVHDGNYTCRATNDRGEAVTTCQLHVNPIEPPRIVHPLSNKQIPEGNSCELRVQFKGTPPIKAEWLINGQPLESTPSAAIPNIAEDKATLKLPAVYLQDVGEYTCSLRNSAGKASTSCRVDLRRRVDRPLNIDDLIDAASVSPNRRPPQQSPLQEVWRSPSRRTFTPARPESQDRLSPYQVYSPVASERRSSWRATSVPPQFSGIYRAEHRRDLIGHKRAFVPGQLPPQFTQPLHNASATEGQMVRLQCRVLGRPQPQIEWFKDGVALTSAPNYTVRSDGDNHWIEFSDIYLNDHGEYTCMATNPAGVAKTSCRMDVEPLSSGDESVDRPPQVVKALPRYLTINEGEGVTLECSFVGRPEPVITWYKDSVVLQTSPNVEITQVGSTAIVNLTDSNIQDAGHYRAVASNRVGVCQSEIHMNILPNERTPRSLDVSPFHEGPPNFSKPLRDIYLKPHTPRLSRLDCFVLGIPRPTVEWRHANQRIRPEDRRYHITADRPPGVHTLTIIQPGLDTAGHYEVLAENKFGRATCSATVHLPRQRSVTPLRSPIVYATLPKQTPTWQQLSPTSSVYLTPTYAPPITRRIVREISEPPELRRYTSTTQLRVDDRHTTPPVQFTFRLPPERTMSKVEILGQVEPMQPSGPQIRHASSLTVLNRMQVCPVVPLQETAIEHRVASHPRVTPGYLSTEDLQRPIDVVPMVPVYETHRTFQTSQVTTPLSRTVSQERFKVLVETPIRARPQLEPGISTEVLHQKTIQVTPIIPMYRTQREASVTIQPTLEPGYTSEGEIEHNIEVVPMVPSYKTEAERPVPARPALEVGYESKATIDRMMEIEKELTELRYKTEAEKTMPARPPLESGFESKANIERQMMLERELTELRYKTQMNKQVAAQPQLQPGFEAKIDIEHSMDVVPLVQKPEEKFTTSYATDVDVQYVPVDLVVEIPTPPKFVKHLNNVVAEEGSQVILEGIVIGKPTPVVSWFKKSTPITDTPDFRLEYRPDGTVKLTLKEFHEEDIGPYRCEATNLAGTAESYAYLTITTKALAPRFIKGLENTTIMNGGVLRLTVKVDGHPKPDVKWAVNGHDIISSPDFIIEEFADGVHTLTVPRAFVTDTGRYSVVAKNEAGEAITSGIVTVLESRPTSAMPSPLTPFEEVARTELSVPLASPAPGPIILPNPEAPTFIKPLPPQRRVDEGTPMVLTVEAKGNPMPFLHWYQNGVPLQTGPKFKISQFGPHLENIATIQPEPVKMVSELEILGVSPSDTGTIACAAENPFGRAETTLTLDVLERPVVEPLQPEVQPHVQAHPQRPWFTIPLQPEITVQSGSPLTLTAEAMGNPLPFLHWYRDGQPLDSTPDRAITQQGPQLAQPEALLDGPVPMTGRLIINELFPTDSGIYRCVAENSVGQTETFLNLNVVQPPSTTRPLGQRPQVIKGLPFTYPCKMGETVVLETEIYGQPPPSVSWYRSGLEIYPDNKYRLESNPNTGLYRLVIQSISQEDFCEYKVRATNEYGSVESVTRLTLIQEYTELTRIDLSRPMAPVTVEVPYTPSERTQLDVQVQGKFSPVVMDVEIEKPQHHMTELEMQIERPTTEFQPVTVEFQHPEKAGQPAVFVRRLPDTVTLNENIPSRVTAQVSGIPKPTVTFLKNGQPLQPSNSVYPIIEPDNTVVLTFAQPNQSDAGTFTLLAKNPYGQDSTTVQVNLNPPLEHAREEPTPMNVPPIFIRAPFPIPSPEEGQPDVIHSQGLLSAQEGVPMKLEVKVQGVPEPEVSWILNDRPVRPDFKHKLLKLPESVYCLSLESPMPMPDSGTYRCVASNPAGFKELIFPVQIHPKPQQLNVPPKFITKPAPKLTATSGQTLSLECTFEGVPTPVVSWHKDGKLIPPNDLAENHVSVFITENTTQLSITEVVPEDCGIWQCLASSTAGSATCRTKLEVEVPKPISEEPQKMLFIPKKRTSLSGPSDSPYPEIRQPPKSIEIVEGNSARFSTMISGSPRPVVNWYINGIIVQPVMPIEGSAEEPRESVYFDGLLYHLELRRCQPEESGIVTVEALRSDISEEEARAEPNAVVTATANLKIQPAPGKIPQLRPVQKAPIQQPQPTQSPVIVQGPKNADVQENTPVAFTCQVAGTPMPEVTWFRGSQEIRPTENTYVTMGPDGVASLHIEKARPEDAGDYTVRASNPAGEEKAPEFVIPFPDEVMQLPEGASLTLDIEAVGKPIPQLVWKRDSTPFSPTPEIQIIQVTPTHHRLEIVELFEIPEETTIPLECIVRGEPQPQVRYFHNDVEFYPPVVKTPTFSSKYEVMVDKPAGSYTLFLHNLRTKEDDGEYIIRAENELGISVCKTILNVERIDHRSQIQFTMPLPAKKEVTIGQPSEIECEANSDEPVKFQWFINGIEIQRTAPEYIIQDIGLSKSTLVIPVVKQEMINKEIKVKALTSKGESEVSTTIVDKKATTEDVKIPVKVTKNYDKPDGTPRPTLLRFVQPLEPNMVPN